MQRDSRFLESSSTTAEDSYEYRIEWNDHITVDYNFANRRTETEHHGSGSRDISGFDNAWDTFNDCKNNPDFIGVRIIRIDSYGSESVYASS